MKIVYFTHSLVSCWNHGNAHFLRGVLRELVHRGHEVVVFEPEGAWSLTNLLADHGEMGLAPFRSHYPELHSRSFSRFDETERELEDADLVLVHEWNEPELVAAVGALRRRGARFLLFFHDTHHRAVSDSAAIGRFDLEAYDGVLAFGAALAEVYRRRGWGGRAFVWHEAADVRLFRPPHSEVPRNGLVWIGNWGDDERTEELESFLLRPARTVGLRPDVYGVRYPPEALSTLAEHGAAYRGWLANSLVPSVFARHLATVHVPRLFYARVLPGIPTIRVFEALACGIPLISAPWEDTEGLFRAGRDFLMARSEDEMVRHLRAVLADAGLRQALAASGLATVLQRHTCVHRVDELFAIVRQIRAPAPAEALA